jgi:ureidoglycolate lyase
LTSLFSFLFFYFSLSSRTGAPVPTTRIVHPEDLEPARFAPFGQYASLTGADGPHLGAAPIVFYRDQLPLETGGKSPTFATCRVEPRDFVIDTMEYHSSTGEGILPLDGDVLVQVAPATATGAPYPEDEVRVFRVPRGTMLAIRPGVWHHAPFALGSEAVNVLIVLPERTYANDTRVLELSETQRARIAIG